jgi:Toxin PAAR-like domain
MGVTLPAATMKGGQAMPTGPLDVCNVPAPPAGPIPTPFPNIGTLNMALSTTTTVLFENMPVLVEMSETPISSGDEAGVAGGLISGMFIGPVACKMGSMTVKAQGKSVMTMTGLTAHNGKNANVPVGMIVLASNAKVLVAK